MNIEMIKIIEAIVGVCSVIGLLWIGIIIGREYGSFEKFFLAYLEELKENIESKEGEK